MIRRRQLLLRGVFKSDDSSEQRSYFAGLLGIVSTTTTQVSATDVASSDTLTYWRRTIWRPHWHDQSGRRGSGSGSENN